MKPTPHQKVFVYEKKPVCFPRPNPHALIIVHWSRTGKLPVMAMFTHWHFLRFSLLFWGVSLDRSPLRLGGRTDSEERLLACKLNHTPRSPETRAALFSEGKKQPGYYSSQFWIDAAQVYLLHIRLLEYMPLSQLKITLRLSASGSANELSKCIRLKG